MADIKLYQLLIPFFNQIPVSLLKRIDVSEFFYPSEKLNDMRIKLEIVLNHYVMTYQRHKLNLSIPLYSHLCSNLKHASLTNKQKNIVKQYEKLAKKYLGIDVNFVVYQKPMVFIDPHKGPLANFYARNV